MRRARAVLLAALAATVATTTALPAAAHQQLVSRAIKIETAPDRIYVWVSLRVPSGRHKDALLATTRRYRDGTLDPTAKKGLERALAVRALDGVALTVEGATVSLDRAELKLSAPPEADAPLDLAILGSAPLADTAQHLALNIVRASDPTELTVLPGARAVVETSRGVIVHGGVETVMGSPDRVRWTIAPADKRAPPR